MPGEISKWLAHLGLDQYSSSFSDNDIDIQLLPELTDADLKELESVACPCAGSP